MILGTGSPHAAKMYASHGFLHLAGGLEVEGGKKGYNPDDLGEWIMIRYPHTQKESTDFDVDLFVSSFYCRPKAEDGKIKYASCLFASSFCISPTMCSLIGR